MNPLGVFDSLYFHEAVEIDINGDIKNWPILLVWIGKHTSSNII